MANLATRGPSGVSGYRAALRDVFGGFGSKARALGSNIQRVSSAGLAQYRQVASTDTLGGLFAQQVGPGFATAGMGVLDSSQIGAWFSGLTGGIVNASSAVTVGGIILRAFDIDRNYLGRAISGANGALIRGMIPKWTYDLGSRVPGAAAARMASLTSAGAPNVSGVQTQERPQETIPEVTVS